MKAPAVNVGAGAVLALAGLAGLVVLGLYLYAKRGTIAGAAGQAAAAVNPADSRNLVNRGVSAAGAAVTGNQDWTLGGQLADWFSPSVRAADRMVREPVATPGINPQPLDLLDFSSPFVGAP